MVQEWQQQHAAETEGQAERGQDHHGHQHGLAGVMGMFHRGRARLTQKHEAEEFGEGHGGEASREGERGQGQEGSPGLAALEGREQPPVQEPLAWER